MARLETRSITLAYTDEPVIDRLSVEIPDGQITSIIGPNGCGKSTLLRALVRLMRANAGAALLDGEAVHSQPTKEVAKRLGLLPQGASAPESIIVEDLVRRGRFPHQSMFSPPTDTDRLAVEGAIEAAGVSELRKRPVDELSGGQRQRAWIAMALAQETPILLLDEPTTYLDVAHQQEVLGLVRRLNLEQGKTVVMVLHDINEAARSSDHVIAMRDGAIVAEGPPGEVIRPDVLRRVFDIEVDVVTPAGSGSPMCVPRSGDPPCAAPATRAAGTSALAVELATLAYERMVVSEELSVEIPEQQITAIVGPNACGKSTLLRALAHLMKPRSGSVRLDGRPLEAIGRRPLAQALGLLPQAPQAPLEVTIDELVAAGRAPHQRWYRQWSGEDAAAVEDALARTETGALRARYLEELSGGQRQRAWIAMALARRAPLLLLDEPTTFLDIAHQVEVLDLVRRLNAEIGTTVAMVLHDLSQACRYADHLVVMRDGRIVATGDPREIVTASLVEDVFGVSAHVIADERTGRPLVLTGGSAVPAMAG